MNKLSVIFFLFSFFLNHSQAQLADLQYEIYSSSEGFSPIWDTPDAIVQDKNGYIWLRGYYGLNRFDGYEFKIYNNDPDNPASLKSNYIQDLFVDYQKRLWVVTNNGPNGYLSIYSPELDNFMHYHTIASIGQESQLSRVRKIHQLGKGKYWVFTINAKIYQFDTDKRDFKMILPENKFLSILTKGYIGIMFNDSHGNYWADVDTGLIKYNTLTGDFKIFKPEKGNRRSLKSSWISTIYEDTSGTIFIGTNKSGLHRYDPENDLIIQLPENSGKYKYIQPPQSKGPLYYSDGDMTIIKRLSDGTFWLATINGGLKIYNHDFTKSQLYTPYEQNQKYKELDFITYLFEDNQKNVWLNAFSSGLLKFRSPRSLFSAEGNGFEEVEKLKLSDIRGIFECHNKTILIGTSDGTLVHYNPENDKAKVFKTGSFYGTPKNKLSGSDYQAFFEDEDGQIWIASFNGIIKYNPENSHFEKLQFKSEDGNYEGTFDTEAIIADDNSDYIWIATWMRGLIRYNHKTMQADFFHWKPDSTSLLSNNIYSLYKTRSGDIAACTDKGLSIYMKSTGQFDNYLIGTSLNSAYEDTIGVLWLGSNEGLFRINRKKNTVDQLTTDDGLPTNMVAGILADESYLWIGTAQGLVRFNPVDQSIIVFNEEDGVQLNLFERANSYYKTSDGLFLFGGVNGLTVFDSKKISINNYPPNVLITELAIYDNSNNEHFIKRNWNHEQINTIELPYYQNEIEFNYVGIHYKNPKRNKYKYQLKPYDQSWKNAGNQRMARYTSLDPGDYTFKVMACNSDGIWNPKPAALHIMILPPWWETWWASSLYVLFGFGLLFSIRQFELKRRREKEENKRKSKELEEARQLQLSMLPKELPQLPHLDIAVYMQTATEVGGDYYDFNVSLDGTLTVVIGDATGHGMKAGTMVTAVKSLFNGYASNADILFTFNEFSRCIRQMNFGRVSMCLTMLKISDHNMQIATAGMPPSYIYRSKSKEVEEYQFEAMPLGAMKKFPYRIKETQLYPGDTVLLISDGLPELENKDAEMFGYSRIKDGFECIAEKSPDDIISYLKNEGASWANNNDPGDDVTFVVIKVK